MPLSVCNDGCLRRPSFIIIKQNGLGGGLLGRGSGLLAWAE